MSKKKVYVVGGSPSCAYTQMFLKNGWKVVYDMEEADLIQFTGGADVTPSYYQEVKHPATINTPDRDAIEADIYYKYTETPMAGICRGAQFLNVMCGGSLFQDVNNHAIPINHQAYLITESEWISVSSTHHQMMRPSREGEVLMTAGLSSVRAINEDIIDTTLHHTDVEACMYREEDVLCYQPHPEFFDTNHECQKIYFKFIDKLLGV